MLEASRRAAVDRVRLSVLFGRVERPEIGHGANR
jgi:hypothetical protein